MGAQVAESFAFLKEYLACHSGPVVLHLQHLKKVSSHHSIDEGDDEGDDEGEGSSDVEHAELIADLD